MKTLLLFLFPLFCTAQYIGVNEIDEFTGDKKVQVNCMTGKRWGQSDNITNDAFFGIFLTAQYTKSKSNKIEIYFFTLNIQSNNEDICINPDSGKTILLFEDKSTIECKQISENDCSHINVVGKYSIDLSDIEKLSTTPLKKFRVYNTEGYRDYEVYPKKNDLIKNTFAVLKATVTQ